MAYPVGNEDNKLWLALGTEEDTRERNQSITPESDTASYIELA